MRYATWEPWQQDVARSMISRSVLGALERIGYDVKMFRQPPHMAGMGTKTVVPRLLRHGDEVYALAQTLAMKDLGTVEREALVDLQEAGLRQGATRGEIWQAIGRVLAGAPQLMGAYRGHNLIAYRGAFYAVQHGMHLNFESLTAEQRRTLVKDRTLLVGGTATIVKRKIDDWHWQMEMRRQREIVKGWPRWHRWLWNTRKRIGHFKRILRTRR
jgi:hypothetical protein